jgi:hypothetical protein
VAGLFDPGSGAASALGLPETSTPIALTITKHTARNHQPVWKLQRNGSCEKLGDHYLPQNDYLK